MLRSHAKRNRDDDPNAAPGMSLVPTVVPGVMQKAFITAMYQTASNATSGAAIADGIIWRPMMYGGTSIMRTALAAKNTVFTASPVVPFIGGSFSATTLRFTLIDALMVPVAASIGGSQIVPRFDITETYYQARYCKGKLTIRCNTSGVPGNNVISGTLGAAWVGDTRGIYDFDRGKLPGKSMYGANCATESINTGTTIEIPAFSPGYTQTRRVFSDSGGSLISYNPAVTDINNCFFVSHLARASFCTNILLPEIPWGAVPNFTVSFNGSGETTPTLVPVRCLHVFAFMDGTGANVYSVSESYATLTSDIDLNVVDIKQPQPPNQFCIWIGTAILFAYSNGALAIPVSMNIRAWLPFEQERCNAAALVARIDGAAPDAMIALEGIITTQCALTSSSYFANVSTIEDPSMTPGDQFQSLLEAVSTPSKIIRSGA